MYIVAGKVFVDRLSSRYYHESCMQWCGLLYTQKVTTSACLLSTRVLGFFSSVKGNLDLSYSPAQLCGAVNPENCLAIVQVKALDVKYFPFYI